MSDIIRSLHDVTGDLTIHQGDLKIEDPTKGIVMEDNVGELDRIKVFGDSTIKAVEIEELP